MEVKKMLIIADDIEERVKNLLNTLKRVEEKLLKKYEQELNETGWASSGLERLMDKMNKYLSDTVSLLEKLVKLKRELQNEDKFGDAVRMLSHDIAGLDEEGLKRISVVLEQEKERMNNASQSS
jgi:hypothetical protein